MNKNNLKPQFFFRKYVTSKKTCEQLMFGNSFVLSNFDCTKQANIYTWMDDCLKMLSWSWLEASSWILLKETIKGIFRDTNVT